MYVYLHTFTRTCIHAYKHTYIHPCIHTYIHTTYIPEQGLQFLVANGVRGVGQAKTVLPVTSPLPDLQAYPEEVQP